MLGDLKRSPASIQAGKLQVLRTVWFGGYSEFGIKFLNLSEPLCAHLQKWNSNTISVPAKIGDGSLSRPSLTLFLLVQRGGNCRTLGVKDQSRKFSLPLFAIWENAINIQRLPSLLPSLCQNWSTFRSSSPQASGLEQLIWSERRTRGAHPHTP